MPPTAAELSVTAAAAAAAAASSADKNKLIAGEKWPLAAAAILNQPSELTQSNTHTHDLQPPPYEEERKERKKERKGDKGEGNDSREKKKVRQRKEEKKHLIEKNRALFFLRLVFFSPLSFPPFLQ